MSGSPSRAARWSLALGLLAALVAGAYNVHWLRLAARGTFRPVDFGTFYAGAAIVRDGQGIRLYNLDLQGQYQLALLGGLPLSGHVLPFLNPPHLAIALVPFAALPFDAALGLWRVLQLVLVALLVGMCAVSAANAPLHERLLLIASLFSFPMLFVTVYKGQISLIVLVAILCWIRALRQEDDVATAGWLLLGTIKPQLILVPVLIVALARRWRALLLFGAGCGLIAVISAVVVGTESLVQFVTTMRWADRTFDNRLIYPAYMYNFKGALTLILGIRRAEQIMILSRAGFVLTLLAIVGLWQGRVVPGDERFELKLALTLLLTLFFTLHLYFYDVLMLVAVASLFLSHLRRSGAAVQRALFFVLTFVSPLLFLESGWLVVAGWRVRWPTVLMLLWMLWMGLELRWPAVPRSAPSAAPSTGIA